MPKIAQDQIAPLTLATVPAGYTHSISYAAAYALSSRPTARTDVIIRVFGRSLANDPALPWAMLDNDFEDVVP